MITKILNKTLIKSKQALTKASLKYLKKLQIYFAFAQAQGWQQP